MYACLINWPWTMKSTELLPPPPRWPYPIIFYHPLVSILRFCCVLYCFFISFRLLSLNHRPKVAFGNLIENLSSYAYTNAVIWMFNSDGVNERSSSNRLVNLHFVDQDASAEKACTLIPGRYWMQISRMYWLIFNSEKRDCQYLHSSNSIIAFYLFQIFHRAARCCCLSFLR